MKYKYKRVFLTWNPGRLFIDWMRRIRFRRYENVSLYTLTRTFLRKVEKDEIIDRANGVAFNFILAIFPAVLFLFTLIPYISLVVPSVNETSIIAFLNSLLPESMSPAVTETIKDIAVNTRGGLLTFGFLFSLYLSTNGMMSLMRAFNACYKTIENRSGLRMRLIATGLTVAMAFVLILAIILLVVGQIVLDYATGKLSGFEWINLSSYTVYLLLILRFVVIFIAFFIAIALIYYFGPAIHYNWRFFSAGSSIATILCLAVTYGFSFYITNFGTYNKLYGSIGVLIALMVWMQLITIVLMVGYEINASIHQAVRTQVLLNAKKEWKR
ncbi:MAG: YihY/virulence factor BrkB family protein [Cyclobacteriaceae bacterium]|nr:YihY/virulence factor BrkB family protein [Cyclobacteriaceae bacterium]